MFSNDPMNDSVVVGNVYIGIHLASSFAGNLKQRSDHNLYTPYIRAYVCVRIVHWSKFLSASNWWGLGGGGKGLGRGTPN
jgi:hypothetical protein